MLTTSIERYLALRRSLGFKLHETSQILRSFARFAATRGDTHVKSATAIDWATEASSPNARRVHLQDVVRLARFLHGEDPAHDVPPMDFFHAPKIRPLPYIYTPEQVAQIVAAAHQLRESYPLRRQTLATLLGFIAVTGLRASEALNLRLQDVSSEGVIQIQNTKFGKNRLIPLHPTVVEVLKRYLAARSSLAVVDDHVFLSRKGQRIPYGTLRKSFRRILRLAEILPSNRRDPRIHDLRHTFASRALETCGTQPKIVSRHFVALATYLGHAEIANTYWYLQASPALMADIAATTEALVSKGGS